jgi:hypothetical protein
MTEAASASQQPIRRVVPHLGIDDTASSSSSNATNAAASSNKNASKQETGWKCAMLVNRRSRVATLPSCRMHGQAMTVSLEQKRPEELELEEPGPASSNGASDAPLGPLGTEAGENVNRVSVWNYWRQKDLLFACARCQEVAAERKAIAEDDDEDDDGSSLCADARRRRSERVSALYEEASEPANLRVSVVKSMSPAAEWAVIPVVLFSHSFPQSLPSIASVTLLCLHCPDCCMLYISPPDATDLRHAHGECNAAFTNLTLCWKPKGLRYFQSQVLPKTPTRWPGPGRQDRAAVHMGVQCDGCGLLPIRGTRYTCTVCADLDLCSVCQQRQHHADTSLRHPNHLSTHPMVSLPRPEEIGLFRNLDMARARALLNMGVDENASAAVSMKSTGPGWSRSWFVEATKDQTDKVEAVICSICYDVARDAKVTPCGHIFCVAGNSAVNLNDGTSAIISEVTSGSEVLSFEQESNGLVPRRVTNSWNRGKRQCIELLLDDGRILTCTPDHRILTTDGWIEAQHLKLNSSQITVGIEYPLVSVKSSSTWSFDASATLGFQMNMTSGQKCALAFARCVGYCMTDGSIRKSEGKLQAAVYLGHSLDVKQCLDDIFTLTSAKPKVGRRNLTYEIRFPLALTKTIVDIGVTSGARIGKVTHLPAMFLHPECPLDLVREFVAGLFGGDGWTISANHARTLQIGGLGFGWNKKGPVAHEQAEIFKMELIPLLLRLGIPPHMSVEVRTAPDCILSEAGAEEMARKKRKHECLTSSVVTEGDFEPSQSYSVVIKLRAPCTLPFLVNVGFRWCCHKQMRLSAVAPYYRRLAYITTQREAICQEVQKLRTTKFGSIPACVTEAKRRLAAKVIIHPEVEAWVPTEMKQVCYPARSQMSVEQMFTNYDISKFFSQQREQGYRRYSAITEDAPSETPSILNKRYGVHEDRTSLPTFSIPLVGKRDVGVRDVFDLTVPCEGEEPNFTANGIVVHNCHFCLTNSVALTKNQQCPNDRISFNATEVLENTSSEDLTVRASIASFPVRCLHAEECKWTGELRLLEQHIHEECHWRSCPLAPFGCTNIFPKNHEKDWDHVESSQRTACTETQHQQLLRRHMLHGAAHVDKLADLQKTLLDAVQSNAHMTAHVLSQAMTMLREAAALKQQCDTLVASLDDRGRAICNTAVLASLLAVRQHLRQQPPEQESVVHVAPTVPPAAAPSLTIVSPLQRRPLFAPRPFVRPTIPPIAWLPRTPMWTYGHVFTSHQRLQLQQHQHAQQQQQQPLQVRQWQPLVGPNTLRNAVDSVCAIQ